MYAQLLKLIFVWIESDSITKCWLLTYKEDINDEETLSYSKKVRERAMNKKSEYGMTTHEFPIFAFCVS